MLDGDEIKWVSILSGASLWKFGNNDDIDDDIDDIDDDMGVDLGANVDINDVDIDDVDANLSADKLIRYLFEFETLYLS